VRSWRGDPSLYDSTLRILELSRTASTSVRRRAGVTAIQA
jgi:precorrin-2 methylase